MNVIKEQIDTVVNGIGVDALKTGMLPTVEIIEYVGSVLKDLKNSIVIDPVMVCKVNSGSTENLFRKCNCHEKSFIALRNCRYTKLV